MNASILAFIIWVLFGCFMIVLGIYSFSLKKPISFYANVETFKVTDIKKYNKAVGILYIIYGIIFIILGIPLLGKQNSPYIILSILGVMIETLTLMIIYSLYITKKYKR